MTFNLRGAGLRADLSKAQLCSLPDMTGLFYAPQGSGRVMLHRLLTLKRRHTHRTILTAQSPCANFGRFETQGMDEDNSSQGANSGVKEPSLLGLSGEKKTTGLHGISQSIEGANESYSQTNSTSPISTITHLES